MKWTIVKKTGSVRKREAIGRFPDTKKRPNVLTPKTKSALLERARNRQRWFSVPSSPGHERGKQSKKHEQARGYPLMGLVQNGEGHLANLMRATSDTRAAIDAS